MRQPLTASGFTLVELLLVVAVLGILASLLLPAVGLVKSLAKGSQCVSNLRQIHLALTAYEADNTSQLPAGWMTASVDMSWDDLLSDYDGRDLPLYAAGNLDKASSYLSISGALASSRRLFGMYGCPADENGKKGPVIGGAIAPGFWNRTYVFTGDYTTAHGAPNPGMYSVGGGVGFRDWSANVRTITNPSQRILLLEKLDIFASMGRSNDATCRYPASQGDENAHSIPYSTIYGAPPQPLHRGKWSYLFCDGHVELLTSTQTKDAPGNASSYPGPMWKRNQ